MSDEYHLTTEPHYSSFWPLLIIITGLLIWAGYQDYAVNDQRSTYERQLRDAVPAFKASQVWQAKYNGLMQDLSDTSKTNQNAAAIFKEAVRAGVQAGLIHVQQNSTNSTTAPAAPAASGNTNAPAATTPSK